MFRIPDLHTQGISKMVGLLTREKVDLVYGNNPSTYARNTLLAARLLGLPYIWHFRSVKWHWGWREGIFLRLASRIIAVSQACADPLARFIPAGKIRIIYNGVDVTRFQEDPKQARQYLFHQVGLTSDAKILVNIGHLRQGKGQAEQVEIMRRLVNQSHDLHLVLIGSLSQDPEYVTLVQQLITAFGLEQRIHLIGLRDDVHRMLAGADIYIHTSKQEAHPRSIIEAMAGGLPVVSFAVGGVLETVVDGKTGCLINYGDCTAMSTAIETLLKSPQMAAAFGEHGQQRVQQHFTAAGTASKIDGVLREIL